jgi:hypothetical protein
LVTICTEISNFGIVLKRSALAEFPPFHLLEQLPEEQNHACLQVFP